MLKVSARAEQWLQNVKEIRDAVWRAIANVPVVLYPGMGQPKGEKQKRKTLAAKNSNRERIQFLKDSYGFTKNCVKYLIVPAILTKGKTKVVLNSSYRRTCSILRPNDHPYNKCCIERSVSVLFVSHTIDVCKDEAERCDLGIQFCHRFHRTVAVNSVLH